MERKIARQMGDRSQEELQKLNKEINLQKLVTSNKQLQDERRIIERVIEKLITQKATLKNTIDELDLINKLAEVDLAKVSSIKEKTLV
jgi:hypothetical protein